LYKSGGGGGATDPFRGMGRGGIAETQQSATPHGLNQLHQFLAVIVVVQSSPLSQEVSQNGGKNSPRGSTIWSPSSNRTNLAA